MQILRAFAPRGAPKRRVRDWTGRWWSPWGAYDLVPMGNLRDRRQSVRLQSVHGCDGSRGHRPRQPAGSHWPLGMEAMAKPCAAPATRPAPLPEVWFAGGKATREKAVAAEMERRYGPRKRRLPASYNHDLGRSRQNAPNHLDKGRPRSYRRPRAHPIPCGADMSSRSHDHARAI